MANPQAIMDIECYQNYLLVKFIRLPDKQPIEFEVYNNCYDTFDIDLIKRIINKYEIITFNGNKYDIPMLKYAFKRPTNMDLKIASDEIINNQLRVWEFEKKYKLDDYYFNHVDLIELCIGKVSLKTYAGRLHCKKLQDLPYDPWDIIDDEKREQLKIYCMNDLENTERILQEVTPQLDLRRVMSNEYKQDLRSKSDAQIAEAVIKTEILKKGTISKVEPAKVFHYDPPRFINKDCSKLQSVLEVLKENTFTMNYNGDIVMPKELSEMKIKIGKSTYQMGMGGLHSTEKSVNHVADDIYLLADFDVTSYYPSIILNCELYPGQLGKEFLKVYRQIVVERIYAKQAGVKTKADCLKIVVNGGFGKFGSKYSILYAPKLMVQVTVTGQLSLLMLISELEEHFIHVISANTDGIVVKCQRNREHIMLDIVKRWEDQTKFTMERSDYKALYSRDINNYIAIKLPALGTTKQEIKTKGYFSKASLAKNPNCEILSLAIQEFLLNGIAIEDTIKNDKNISHFTILRKVEGGALQNNEYIGKVIRWYYSVNNYSCLKYKSGDNVPDSQGAKPLMELPAQFPGDVDYDKYIKKCKETLNLIGVNSIGQMSLF